MTDFGLFLKEKKPKNVIIVTTKNNLAARKIISFYDIEVQKVYGNEEIRPYGSKGELLNHLMLNFAIDEIVFIDDSIKHLATVRNKNISCYFADWGYEKYQECEKYPLATIDLFSSYVNSKNKKTVIITGASSGIGLECAKLFHKNNYFVIGFGKDKCKLSNIGNQLFKNKNFYQLH